MSGKTTYLKKKLQSRLVKYKNILEKKCDVKFSDVTTKDIIICNAGLSNGIDQCMIFEVFSKYGNLQNIISFPKESFSIVSFVNDESAATAMKAINCSCVWESTKGPLYMNHIECTPHAKIENLMTKFTGKPSGLMVLNGFITEDEEKTLINAIKMDEDLCDESSQLKHRRVKHYGYEFRYGTNDVDPTQPIGKLPQEIDFLWNRLKDTVPGMTSLQNFIPNQLTVNYYQPGQGIPPHVDTHSPFEDIILSLSLLSDIIMEFKNTTGVVKNLVLPKRSLCVMSGESRLGWTHAIVPRKTDLLPTSQGYLTVRHRQPRLSLTFRQLRENAECNCSYKQLCDSYKNKMKNLELSSIKGDKVAAQLEGEYVHNVYNKIADHFSCTRHTPWPKVSQFLSTFANGSVILDVGCGNGKYLGLHQSLYEIGTDTSSELTSVCAGKGVQSLLSNCLHLPIKDNSIDGVICIAVIHHLATEERRLKAVSEIVRILRVGGDALIYVWAKNQETDLKKSSYLKQNKHKNSQVVEDVNKEQLVLRDSEVILPVHENRTNFQYKDMLVPWKLKISNNEDNTSPSVFLRFYHVFEENELKTLCDAVKNIRVDNHYYDQGNWCVQIHKLSQESGDYK